MKGLSLSVLVVLVLAACGCGGDDGPSAPQTPGSIPASITIAAGSGQVAPIRSVLPSAVAFSVKDSEGRPVRGAIVDFAVTAGGGVISAQADTTGNDGLAQVRWLIGPAIGSNSLTATVRGYPQFAATATATGRLPHWTVMVYIAADNTLAVQGVLDIDEIEAAGYNPDVQVVIQAEFSPTALSQAGCGQPACFNRPNFNTFRYPVLTDQDEVQGPDGDALDIGNINMADPAELADFMLWTANNFPAERTCLILWNHGGGYVGLIEDQTSAPGILMSMADLQRALSTGGKVDVLDFDMCLMGAYETLASIDGQADYVVFSEEVVPGAGNPYTAILNGLQANTHVDGRGLATLIADRFHDSYQNNRASTTVSAYDCSRFAAFEEALNGLAAHLKDNLADVSTAVQEAAGESQRYSYSEMKDLVDFVARLRTKRPGDTELLGRLDAVQTAAMGNFRLVSHARNGAGDVDVSHSNGLSIVLPSGGNQDRLASQGPRSLEAYSTLYEGKAWAQFLSRWLEGQNSNDYVDQGEDRLETYLVWTPAALEQGVDMDMWVLEPDGTIYIPFIGSVTPNGTFTNDSADDNVAFEGYLTNRYIQPGVYYVIASLYADPNGINPVFNIAYRFDQDESLTLLYQEPPYPTLSKAVSWLDDPDASLDRVFDDLYTDLRLAAGFEVGIDGLARAPMAVQAGEPAARGRGPVASRPELTAEQMQTLRGLARHGTIRPVPQDAGRTGLLRSGGARDRGLTGLPAPFGARAVAGAASFHNALKGARP
mgnify:CR=1 FL=1